MQIGEEIQKKKKRKPAAETGEKGEKQAGDAS